MKSIKVENWNPSVKMISILLFVIILSFQYKVFVSLGVFTLTLIAMVFFSNAKLKSIITFLTPAFFAAFGMFMMGLYYSKNASIVDSDISQISSIPYTVRAAMSTNLKTALQLGTRILAYAGLGIFFALTTDRELFISSLIHQCHLSPKFAYGILSSLHLVPNIGKEYKNALFAFRTRGMKVRFFSTKPLFAMLVNSIYWSENIAMAMHSKGFSDNGDRTYYIKTKVEVSDLILSFSLIILLIIGIYYSPY